MEYPRNNEKWDSILSEIDGLLRAGKVLAALFQAKRLEREGDPLALLELANIYEIGGDGVPFDLDEAIRYYHQYLNIVDDEGTRLRLARSYFRRGRDEDDFAQAHRYFQTLVDSNQCGAHYALGMMYKLGEGVKVDKTKAAEYFLTAMEHGHVEAEVNYLLLQRGERRFKNFWPLVSAVKRRKKLERENPHDWRLSIKLVPPEVLEAWEAQQQEVDGAPTE